jgi:hypothetical protein
MRDWPRGTMAVICCRVGDPYWRDQMPDVHSVVCTCYRCGERVILGERSLPVARQTGRPWELLCVPCAAELAKVLGKWRVIGHG